MSIPPHCTHRLQPLDVSYFKALNTFYDQALTSQMKATPGKPITDFQVAGLLGKAYGKASSVENAISGFRKTGIFPYNPKVFEEWEYAPSLVTERLMEQQTTEDFVNETASSAMASAPELPAASTSNSTVRISPTVMCRDLSPLPLGRQESKVKPTSSRSVPSCELTSSPYLLDLKAKKQAKTTSRNKCSKKLKLCDSSDDDVDDSENQNLGVRRPNVTSPVASDNCVICGEFFRDRELWFRCVACGFWAHKDCTDAETAVGYICDYCSNEWVNKLHQSVKVY